MIKSSFYYYDYDTILTTNQRYLFSKNRVEYHNFTFNKELINKTIPIKFSLYGVNPNTTIQLYLDKTLYELGNTPLELEYIYKEYIKDLIYFKIGEEIDDNMIIEIVVGLMKDNYSSYEEKNFKDLNGNLIIKSKKNLIIKIPKEYDNYMNDYSIILQRTDINIEILYDKMEFMVSNTNINIL